MARWCLCVCLCVCVFKPFRLWRPNGRSDRDGGGTVRSAHSGERLWRGSGIGRWHVPRATCQHVDLYQNQLGSAAAQTAGAVALLLTGRVHPTVNYVLLGSALPRGAPCTHQRGARVFRWGLLISGKFELAPRNLAHRCYSTSAFRWCIQVRHNCHECVTIAVSAIFYGAL